MASSPYSLKHPRNKITGKKEFPGTVERKGKGTDCIGSKFKGKVHYGGEVTEKSLKTLTTSHSKLKTEQGMHSCYSTPFLHL